MKSGIAQHVPNELSFNLVKMHLLNHNSDHVIQLGILLNASYEPSDTAKMGLTEGYGQPNQHDATLQILKMTAYKEVFRYEELNTNGTPQCYNNEMSLTKQPVQRIMEIAQPEMKTPDDVAK
jgi:hypothetical protein